MAEHTNRTKEVVYRNYVCDILKAMAESWSVRVDYQYRELIEPSAHEDVSGDDVALRVIKKLGLEVGANKNGFDGAESDVVA